MPTFYDLTIKPFFKPEQEPIYYEGKVKILLDCFANTNRLAFNLKDINIVDSTLSIKELGGDDSQLTGFKWTYDSERQFFEADLTLADDAVTFFKNASKYELFIDFNVTVRDDNVAFYKSSYLDDNGNKRWLITSQMEPVEARKAFPCFDEPEFKAKYKLKVIHDKSLNVLSNMPAKPVKTM
jgi:aminopeptidase N